MSLCDTTLSVTLERADVAEVHGLGLVPVTAGTGVGVVRNGVPGGRDRCHVDGREAVARLVRVGTDSGDRGVLHRAGRARVLAEDPVLLVRIERRAVVDGHVRGLAGVRAHQDVIAVLATEEVRSGDEGR